MARTFNRDRRAGALEAELSRMLGIAAESLGEVGPDSGPDGRRVASSQRLAAVSVLAESERGMSTLQRLAVVDAAARWLTEPQGGEELAYALLEVACSAATTTEHVYLALIAPPGGPVDRGEGPPS